MGQHKSTTYLSLFLALFTIIGQEFGFNSAKALAFRNPQQSIEQQIQSNAEITNDSKKEKNTDAEPHRGSGR